jgi:hypothetical protein
MAIKTSIEEVARGETNVNLFIKQMGEMSGAVIIIIKTEKNLCIFCEERKRDTKDRAINTDGSLVPIIVNKVIPYRNLEEVRLSYGIGAQDPYFFIRKEPPPGIMIY